MADAPSAPARITSTVSTTLASEGRPSVLASSAGKWRSLHTGAMNTRIPNDGPDRLESGCIAPYSPERSFEARRAESRFALAKGLSPSVLDPLTHHLYKGIPRNGRGAAAAAASWGTTALWRRDSRAGRPRHVRSVQGRPRRGADGDCRRAAGLQALVESLGPCQPATPACPLLLGEPHDPSGTQGLDGHAQSGDNQGCRTAGLGYRARLLQQRRRVSLPMTATGPKRQV